MDPASLQKLAVGSAKRYFTYLDERKRGRVEVSVKEARPNGEFFLLLPMRRLIMLDNLIFSLRGREYPAGSIRIESYDQGKNHLLLYLTVEQQAAFSACRPEDILLISDLKYLITRYRKWMEAYGSALRLGRRAPSEPFSGQLVSGRTPAPDQLKALQAAFSAPLSYIWGAPGTGKTQIVLAYGLLDYFRQGRKVLLLAPTNNAVEQGLFAFLSLLGASPEFETESSFRRVLRLGAPSSAFVQQYPMCCEISGINEQISALQSKIKSIDDCLTLRIFKIKVHLLKKQLLPGVEALIPQAEFLVNVRAAEKPFLLRLDSLRENLLTQDEALHRYERKLEDLLKENSTVFSRVGNYFETNASVQRARDIQNCQSCIDELKCAAAQLEEELFRAMQEHDAFIKRAESKKHKFFDAAEKLGGLVSDVPKLNELMHCLTPLRIYDIRDELSRLEQEADSYCVRKAYLEEEFIGKSSSELEAQRQALQARVHALSNGSAAKRITDALVVGCTIDCFLSRFAVRRTECAYVDFVRGVNDEEIQYVAYPFHHAFLDEAGYCSLAKVMPILCFSAPVTLLGDHMQLPPVCEASDEEIQTQAWRSLVLWAQSAIHLEDLFFCKLDEIAERYLDDSSATFQRLRCANLTITYRFDRVLAKILDDHLYHIGFTGLSDKAPVSLRYLDVSCLPGEKKRTNPGEAMAIRDALPFFGKHFAILTPYRNQAGTIRTMLPAQWRDSVLTVHASQGREWDTVVLSVTDTSNMWFTDSQNTVSRGAKLMNTAISRTAKALVLVCDVRFWRTQPDQLLFSLLDIAEPLFPADALALEHNQELGRPTSAEILS